VKPPKSGPMPVEVIDTCILVDVLRGDADAAKAIDLRAKAADLIVPDVVLAELLVGCRGVREIRQVSAFVRDQFRLVFHDQADARGALDLLATYRPAHGVGYLDCLIAATTIRLNACLLTLNAKHFEAIPTLSVVAPYPPPG